MLLESPQRRQGGELICGPHSREQANQDGKLVPIWQEKRIIKMRESGRLPCVELVRQETMALWKEVICSAFTCRVSYMERRCAIPSPRTGVSLMASI